MDKPPKGYRVDNQGTADGPWWTAELDPDGSDPDDRESVVRACHEHRAAVEADAYARVARWYAAGCLVWSAHQGSMADYIRAGLPGWEG